MENYKSLLLFSQKSFSIFLNGHVLPFLMVILLDELLVVYHAIIVFILGAKAIRSEGSVSD